MKTGVRNALIVGAVALLIAAAVFLPELLTGLSEKSVVKRIREKDASEYLLERTEEDLLKKLQILSRDNTMRMILSIPEGAERDGLEEAARREMDRFARDLSFRWTVITFEAKEPLFPDTVRMEFDSVILMSAFSVSDGSSFAYYELRDDGNGITLLLDAADEKILSFSIRGDYAEEYVYVLEERLRFLQHSRNEISDTGKAYISALLGKSFRSYYGIDTENAELFEWSESEWEQLLAGSLPDGGEYADRDPAREALQLPVAGFDLVRGEDRVHFPIRFEISSDWVGTMLYGPAW